MAAKKGGAKSGPKTAMILCHDEEYSGLLRHYLSAFGVDVVEWNRTGTHWIDKWNRLKPTVVLVDYILPRKDGIFVLRNIQHHNPECAVVFIHSVSGFAANELEMKALKTGAKAVLQRPFSESQFNVCLSRLLER